MTATQGGVASVGALGALLIGLFGCQPAVAINADPDRRGGAGGSPASGAQDAAEPTPPIATERFDAGFALTDAAPDQGEVARGEANACPGGDAPPPATCASIGVTLDPAYAAHYTCYDLGPVPGLPMSKYGGLTLLAEPCSDTLLIGGDANTMMGKLYRIKVKRDRDGHVSGWAGSAEVFAEAPHNDGGVAFGPDGVLFATRWPTNYLMQWKPGSRVPDKQIALDPLNVAFSSASLAFVPAGLPQAGIMKLVSWSAGQWYTVGLRPDGNGTFDITEARGTLSLPGGPEGFVYVAAGSPLFGKHSLLVSEWSANGIAAYEIDDAADPVLTTRKQFISAFKGAEGAYREPVTGDFFFSTWGMTQDRVVAVRGFRPFVVD